MPLALGASLHVISRFCSIPTEVRLASHQPARRDDEPRLKTLRSRSNPGGRWRTALVHGCGPSGSESAVGAAGMSATRSAVRQYILHAAARVVVRSLEGDPACALGVIERVAMITA